MNYILDGKNPVAAPSLLAWAEWYEKGNRIVAQEKRGDVMVSTVFLGIDHNFSGVGPPVLFETMIFGGGHHEYQKRYRTWEEAEAGHKVAMELAFKPQA